MSATVPGKQTPVGFVLTPPEVMSALDDYQASDAIPLSAERSEAVDEQVERFIKALLSEDVLSDSFKFRSKAIEIMGQNHALLGEQLKRAEAYMDKSRQQRLRALSTSGIEGPVKL